MKRKNYWKYVKKNIKKLYFENENLKKKKYDDLVIQYNRTRKTKLIHAKKRKIVISQEFEETESERSDEENEEEEKTEKESNVKEVIPRKKTNKQTNKNVSKKNSKKIKQKEDKKAGGNY